MYLGVRTIMSTSERIIIESGTTNRELFCSFNQGTLVNLLNPKAILFYLSFLPQFVVQENGAEKIQLAFHGILAIALAVLVYIPMIALAGRLSLQSSGSGGARVMLERITGITLIGMGARLALVG